MSRTAIEYFLWVFIAACGTLQIAGAWGKLYGLLVVKRPGVSYCIGFLLVIISTLWFFAINDRNQPGLEGLQQFQGFFVAAVCAVLFTVLAASLTGGTDHITSNVSILSERERVHFGEPEGLEALRARTYVQALIQRWQRAKAFRWKG